MLLVRTMSIGCAYVGSTTKLVSDIEDGGASVVKVQTARNTSEQQTM